MQGQIKADFQALSPALSDEERELERLRIVANGRGEVHGIAHDLEGQFGIGLRRCEV